MNDQFNKIRADGLWNNNAGIVQLLGLCPLLAVSGTVVNALGMGLATTLVLVLSNLTIALIRDSVKPEIRIPVFVMVIATFVTMTELLIQAFSYPLYQALGLFLALITTNCAIIGRAEAFAARNGPGAAALDGLFMGLGFAALLVVLGVMRELIGLGTLFSNMQLLFGPIAENWTIQVMDRGLLLAALPPGAFIAMGLLIAAKNVIDAQRKSKQQALAAPAAA